MHLVLIGYRGTGKSQVARLMAQRLDWPWVDTDDEIERRSGRTIAAIFAEQGETAFRDLESQVLADLPQGNRSVLALGGGAVLRPQNRAIIRQLGTVVWLTAAAETLAARIAADHATAARRPNLTAGGGISEIIATLAARQEVYRECADFQVDTEHRTPTE
ncbi:MAG TPA: shikimate kinase, partial [Pirellulales bacterium]|nr:shikimate kinase [Pirellulales bacterium]